MTSPYAHISLLEHRVNLEAAAADPDPAVAPVHIRFEPTESCNFKCVFCAWHDPERRAELDQERLDVQGKRHIPLDRALKLVNEWADMGVKAVSFTGTGDPMVYPHAGAVLREIRLRGMKAGVTSNLAMKIPEETLQELALCTWVRWSYNGGSEDVYNAIHRPKEKIAGTSFARAKENASRITALSRAAGRVNLNASFVVCEDNKHDVYEAARVAHDCGGQAILYRPDTPMERTGETLVFPEESLRDIARAQKDFGDDEFQVVPCDERLDDAGSAADDLSCRYISHSAYMAPNGDVYPCCYTRSDKNYVMGNIMDRDFASFWKSDARRAFHRKVAYNKCPSCPHRQVNEVLKKLADGAVTVADIAVSKPEPNPFI